MKITRITNERKLLLFIPNTTIFKIFRVYKAIIKSYL